MALELGELYIRINLDSSKFSQHLDTIKKELQTIAKQKIDFDFTLPQTPVDQLRSIKTNVEEVKTSFLGLQSVIKGAVSFAAGQLLINGLYAVRNALNDALTASMNFEHTMSAVRAVLPLTADQLETLRQRAIAWGKETAFTAGEVASAYEILAKNGLTYTQIVGGATEATLALAAATSTDLNKAADIATDAMLSFGMTAEQLPHVVDSITGVTNVSKFSIDDYALALGQAGGAIGGLGGSFEDFNLILAATSNYFNSGSDAGTSFKTFLLRLNPVSKEAAELMQQLGIITAEGKNQFFDASGGMKSMSEIAAVLRNTLGDLTDEQLQDALKTLFGQDAIRTAIGLLNTSDEKFRMLQKTIGDTSAADAAKTRLDNLQGSLTILNGSLDALAIVSQSTVQPVFKNIVDGIIPVVNGITTLVEALQGSETAFNQLSPTMHVAVVALQEFGSYLQEFASLAIEWGANIAEQLGHGILAGAQAIIDALAYIGDIIAYWLAPGSPPRIVPDLDTYGRDAATVYAEGWKKGDFTALNDIGKTVEAYLKSIDVRDVDIFPITERVQASFRTAIQEFKTVGSVSEETFAAITMHAGEAGTTIEQMTRTYFAWQTAINETSEAQERLTAAQQELDAATRNYHEALDPLKQQLKDIQDQQTALSIQKQIDTLQEKQSSGQGTQEDALKLQELLIKQQILAKEKEMQAAVDVAQVNVDAAKANLDAMQAREKAAQDAYTTEKSRVTAIIEQNAKLQEQKRLLEDIANPKGKGGGGGALSGLPTLPKVPDALPEAKNPFAGVKENIEEVRNTMERFREGMRTAKDTFEELKAPFVSIGTGITALGTALHGASTGIQSLTQAFMPSQAVLDGMYAAVLRLQSAFSPIADALRTAIRGNNDWSLSFETLRSIIATTVNAIGTNLSAALTGIASFLEQHKEEITLIVTALYNGITGIIESTLGIIAGIVKTFAGVLTADWNTMSTGLVDIIRNAGNLLISIATGILDSILGAFGTNLEAVRTVAAQNWKNIGDVITQALADIQTWIATKLSELKTFFTTWGTEIQEGWDLLWKTLYAHVGKPLQDAYDDITKKLESIITFVDDLRTRAFEAGKALIGNMWQGIQSAIERLIRDAKEALRPLTDLLPGSEPKDSSSPLYGLSKRGEAFMLNFSEGITRATDTAKKALAHNLDALLHVLDQKTATLKATQNIQSTIGSIFENLFARDPNALRDVASDIDKVKELRQRINEITSGIGNADNLDSLQADLRTYEERIQRAIPTIEKIAASREDLVRLGTEFQNIETFVRSLNEEQLQQIGTLGTWGDYVTTMATMVSSNLRDFMSYSGQLTDYGFRQEDIEQIRRVVMGYTQASVAARQLELATERLRTQQNALNAITEEYNSLTSPINEQLAAIKAKQRALQLETEIAEQQQRANALGGDGRVQAEAQLRLQELLLEQQLFQLEQTYKPQIEARQQQVTLAQQDVAIATQQQQVAQELLSYEEDKIRFIQQQNALLQEQMDLYAQLRDIQALRSTALRGNPYADLPPSEQLGLMQMQTAPSTTMVFNINAQGSQMTEAQFRNIVRQEVNITAGNAYRRTQS